MDISFKNATDMLGLSAADLAEAFGLQTQTIRQMRLAPEAVNYRTPPEGWRGVVLRLARKRARDLEGLIAELERRSK